VFHLQYCLDQIRSRPLRTRLRSLLWGKQQPILPPHHCTMKVQKSRRLERDRQTKTPLRPNPKRTESSDQAIQNAEIRRTPPRAIKDQQLMFDDNGFRGSRRALRLVERHARPCSRHGRGGESDHAYRILAAAQTLEFQRNLEFARDRLYYTCGAAPAYLPR
jgi:hypothetical protein